MRPDDPDFPQDIPPVPEPAAPEAGAIRPSSPPGEGASATPGSGAAPTPYEEGDGWDEDSLEVEAESAAASDVADSEVNEEMPQISRPQPAPTARRGGSGGEAMRVAETPAVESNSSDDWARETVPYQPKELGPIDQLLLLLADGVAQWKRLLRWVRSKLPPNLQRQLPDQVLTALILGLLVLLLAIWNPLGGSPVPVASDQPASASDVPAAGAESDADLAAAAGDEAAPSPEQTLIGDIQTQLASISQAYGGSLIQSINVNLPRNQLLVNLDESWYGLPVDQQDALAQAVYTQVQPLGFATLNLLAPDGQLLARDPVVGSTMVILQRNRPAEDLLASP